VTLEDFAESIVAGYVPLATHPAIHAAIVAMKWIAAHVAAFAVALIARARK
jgi:hypothetical protein